MITDFLTVIGLQESSKAFFSTGSESDIDNANDNDNKAAAGSDEKIGIEDDCSFHQERPPLTLQTIDPRKGWNFRGVHRVWIMIDFIQISVLFSVLILFRRITYFRWPCLPV